MDVCAILMGYYYNYYLQFFQFFLIYIHSQGGLAATFDLAAFGLYMIAPVKKSVNHSKTLTSMREVQRSLARTTREYVSFCSW